MKFIKLSAVLGSILILVGCATVPPQEPVAFVPAEVAELNKISISMNEVPAPIMSYPGANCLLCLGVAASAHRSLSSHVKSTLDISELTNLAEEVTNIFESKGYNTELLAEPINVSKLKKYKFVDSSDARKDHTILSESLDASHLLVLNFDYTGMQRDYSSYFPTSDPYSLVLGYAYLVDISSNKYVWYLPIYEKNSVGEEWKEAPDYPGLTNAFYQGIATVRDKVLTALKL